MSRVVSASLFGISEWVRRNKGRLARIEYGEPGRMTVTAWFHVVRGEMLDELDSRLAPHWVVEKWDAVARSKPEIYSFWPLVELAVTLKRPGV